MALREWIYADESGIHDQAPHCLVAGYRGSPNQWKRFNAAWNNVLSLRDYKISVFHSNEFFNRTLVSNPAKNPYLGWPDAKADRFRDELLGVIRRFKLKPVGCAVNVRDFESFTYGERCVMAGYQPPAYSKEPHPYSVAFRFMIEDALEQAEQSTEFHFFLGLQRELQSTAKNAYALLKNHGLDGRAHQLKGIGFEDPRDFPGIQAADLFVYSWYGYLSRNGQIYGQKRRAMNQLTNNRKDLPNCNAKNIESMFGIAGIIGEDREELRRLRG